MQKKKSLVPRFLCISLAVLIALSVLNWGIVTGWGDVKITHITICGDDGLTYTGLMYIPESASNENPAPANLMIHGNSGNARNHESWAIEYARRGFVVLSIDHLGAGDGFYSADFGESATGEAFIKYLLSCPFVDANRLVVSGHSLGCKPAYVLGTKYGAKTIVVCGGIRATIPTDGADGYYGNMISIIGSAESLRTYETEDENTNKSFAANGVDLSAGPVEYGKLYGSFEEGNAKLAIFNEGQVHEGAFVDKNNIAYQLDFVQQSIDVPNYIDANNQVWMAKDYVGLAGTIVFALCLVLLFLFIMEKVPFFQSIAQPMPRNIGLRGPGLAISIIAAVVFPFIVLWTGAFGLWDLVGLDGAIFHLQQANRAFVIVIGMNILGLVMLFVFWFTYAKKLGAGMRDLGLTSEGRRKLDWGLIGKSLLLAVIVTAIGFAYLSVQTATLGTDFYAWFFGVRSIPTGKLKYYIPYIIVWIFCFIVTSIGLNVERRLPDTGNEAKDIAIATVFNALCACFTVTVVVIIQNAAQISAGLGVTGLAFLKSDMTRLWGMPLGMFIAGSGHTLLYRKTGSIWPGVFLMGIFCALTCCLYGQIRF